jgi:hypothetical protein
MYRGNMPPEYKV